MYMLLTPRSLRQENITTVGEERQARTARGSPVLTPQRYELVGSRLRPPDLAPAAEELADLGGRAGQWEGLEGLARRIEGARALVLKSLSQTLSISST
jgi:hypothetical protein